MITCLKQKKIKLKPTIKLSHLITVIVFPLISALPAYPTPSENYANKTLFPCSHGFKRDMPWE